MWTGIWKTLHGPLYIHNVIHFTYNVIRSSSLVLAHSINNAPLTFMWPLWDAITQHSPKTTSHLMTILIHLPAVDSDPQDQLRSVTDADQSVDWPWIWAKDSDIIHAQGGIDLSALTPWQCHPSYASIPLDGFSKGFYTAHKQDGWVGNPARLQTWRRSYMFPTNYFCLHLQISV